MQDGTCGLPDPDTEYDAKRQGQGGPTIAITVYSTPTCRYCIAVKRYLKERSVRFRDLDVSRDAGAAAEMKRKSGQTGVPVIDVNGRVIVGFDKGRLNSALGIKG